MPIEQSSAGAQPASPAKAAPVQAAPVSPSSAKKADSPSEIQAAPVAAEETKQSAGLAVGNVGELSMAERKKLRMMRFQGDSATANTMDALEEMQA